MRNLRTLDYCRVRDKGWSGDETCGAFWVPSKSTGVRLRVVASSDLGWDHVSVSLPNRGPNWPEMEQIRRLFFCDEECVIQIHAPVAEYVDGVQDGHPYCLHLWRPQEATIPRPPRVMITGSAAEAERMVKDAEDRGEIVR
jgi:hypothetical protein